MATFSGALIECNWCFGSLSQARFNDYRGASEDGLLKCTDGHGKEIMLRLGMESSNWQVWWNVVMFFFYFVQLVVKGMNLV
jgi:hypothetical protein